MVYIFWFTCGGRVNGVVYRLLVAYLIGSPWLKKLSTDNFVKKGSRVLTWLLRCVNLSPMNSGLRPQSFIIQSKSLTAGFWTLPSSFTGESLSFKAGFLDTDWWGFRVLKSRLLWTLKPLLLQRKARVSKQASFMDTEPQPEVGS